MRTLSLIVLFLIMVISMSFASSQPEASAKAEPEALESTEDAGTDNEADKSLKTFIDKIEVYGKIAKPQTVFIIPGTDPRVDGIKIERRFFGDIFRKVEKSTLRKEWNKEQSKRDHLLW